MACLNLSNLFLAFDIKNLTRLAKFYLFDFSEIDVLALDNQLQSYIVDMCSNDEFLELKGIGDLARKMMETNKDVIYPLIYLLVKLVLTIPIATTTIKRSFSAMKYVWANFALGSNSVKGKARPNILYEEIRTSEDDQPRDGRNYHPRRGAAC